MYNKLYFLYALCATLGVNTVLMKSKCIAAAVTAPTNSVFVVAQQPPKFMQSYLTSLGMLAHYLFRPVCDGMKNQSRTLLLKQYS